MKFSTGFAAAAVAMAMVTGGCRYNKAGGSGADALDAADVAESNPTDLSSSTGDIATIGEGASLQGGDLESLAAKGKTFAEQGYKPCGDVSFEPVYFGFDATAIAPAELAKVEAVAKHLAGNPARVVSIEGNCDERGSNEYNMSLGEDRAIVIGNFLAQNGIARERIETVSRGETNPAAEGSGESVWAKNRRGEFIIMSK